MPTITLSIPENLKKEMDKMKEMNWSAVARQAIEKRVNLLKYIKEFTRDSELTEEDAIRLGRKVNKKLSKRFLENSKKK